MRPTVSSPLEKAIADIEAELHKMPLGIKRNITETILQKLQLHHKADQEYRLQLYRHGFAEGMQLIRDKYAHYGETINRSEPEFVVGRQGAPVLREKGEVPIGGPAPDASSGSVRE